MTDKEYLAQLKAELFQLHGTNEVKLKKPVKTGTQDWRAGGGDPTCPKVRAKSETEFEWYLNDWAYGWYGEDQWCNGVEYPGYLTVAKKIQILQQALWGVKRPVENKTENIEDIVEYGSRYGLEALGYAFREMVKSGEIKFTNAEAQKLWEYSGNKGDE